MYEANSDSRTRPWEAAGFNCRRTWERQGKPRVASGVSQVRHPTQTTVEGVTLTTSARAADPAVQNPRQEANTSSSKHTIAAPALRTVRPPTHATVEGAYLSQRRAPPFQRFQAKKRTFLLHSATAPGVLSSFFGWEGQGRAETFRREAHHEAPERLAKSAGFEIIAEYYDAAVSGADPVQARPGFAAMLERIEENGGLAIIVETASRFARDLMVQKVGFAMLQGRGIQLIAADSPGSFLDDTPTAKLIRQVLGAVAEFDKAMTVAKLRRARERKRKAGLKCEGRKSYAERAPEAVALARKLRRKRPKGGRLSLREVAPTWRGRASWPPPASPTGQPP